MPGPATSPQVRAPARWRGRWLAVLRRLRLLAGLSAAAVAVGGAAVAAESDKPRADGGTAQGWQDFAIILKAGIERRFSADDEVARRFQRVVGERQSKGSLPPSVLLSAWVSERKISRIVVDDGDPGALASEIRMLLEGEDIGTAPADMPQPVRLRFVLRPRAAAAPAK